VQTEQSRRVRCALLRIHSISPRSRSASVVPRPPAIRIVSIGPRTCAIERSAINRMPMIVANAPAFVAAISTVYAGTRQARLFSQQSRRASELLRAGR